MPNMKLSKKEASALKAKRARDKSWNTTLEAVVDKIKPRLKATDPLEVAVTTAILHDLRKMIR